MKQILSKIRTNQPLTDDEIVEAIVHFTNLANLLSFHNYENTLADVRKELQMLEMIYDLRIADRLKIKGC
jgi:hypothetical protein